MKKYQKNKINKTKLFKRFLKENGIFAYYKRVVDKSIKINEFFRVTPPIDYISETPTIEKLDKASLMAYNPQWKILCNIGYNKDLIVNEFILFLKKRGLYEEYIKNFDKGYTGNIVEHQRRMINNGWYNSTTIEPLIDAEYKSWENLNPLLYIQYTKLYYDEPKWKTLDIRWKEQLSKIYTRTK